MFATRSFLLVAALCAVSPALRAAPKFIESPPLTQILQSAAVKDVAGGSPLQVPIITWGGDIATLVANGNQAITGGGSPFATQGLSLKLVREDAFPKQVEAYLAGKSPYLRGTVGMLNMAADVLNKDPRTKPVVIHQLSWSAGGDALVVAAGIGTARDLKGKRIGLQAYGPHVDYLTKILSDSGLSTADVTLRWLPDLTGTANSAAAALQAGEVDAAFVITPDALVLTSGGTVGSGAEDSVRGARVLLSTKTANRIIADVYAVRSDYLGKNRKQVQAFVHALLQGEEKLRALVAAKSSRAGEYRNTFSAAAKLLLDSEQAIEDAEGLYADAELTGFGDNRSFLSDPNAPRGLAKLTREIQASFAGLGLVRGGVSIAVADWDYDAFKTGLTNTGAAEAARFDPSLVAAVVTRKQQQGTLGQGELFSFEIFFEPNQNAFSADLYARDFEKVVDLASTYGGAVITIEGHSDPMAFLRAKKEAKPELVLGQVKQAAKNLSLTRAVAVRDAIIGFANGKSISLDESQFAVVGHGIAQPKNGICGTDPCAPKTDREWRDNMRVQFRIIQVEAESSMFRPL